MRSSMYRCVLAHRSRTVQEWKRIASLGWPITVQHAVRTMMRTTDLIVAGLFGPVAIAALGLANLYTQVPLRIGVGIGTSALALSSQETGTGNTDTRNESITQALIIGAIIGIPLAVLGVAFREEAIHIFGAPPDVVALAAPYLAIVLGTAPARHITLIGEKSLQGVGDTLTPMYIRSGSNIVNIIGTVVLALGVGPIPRLEVVGIAIATAGANVLAALAVLYVFIIHRSEVDLVRPTDPEIGRQLVRISVPRSVEGLSITAASFPLNAILIAFGVEIYAAFEVGRTVYDQIVGPFTRSFSVVGSIITGQSLGDGRPDDARFSIATLALLSLIVTTVLGTVMIVVHDPLAAVFSDDPVTGQAAVGFIIVFGLFSPFEGLFKVYSGGLQGAGETTKPFIAEITGVFGLLLGVTYVGGVSIGGGIGYAYAGIMLYGVWRFVLISVWYRQPVWVDAAMRH